MDNTSFSIDPSLVKPALAKLQKQLDEIDERLDSIYRQALINDIPVVQSIVINLRPNPSDCKMLSKVFGRLAELLVVRDELAEKVTLLSGITSNSDWLYDQIGDTGRDVDSLLKSILTLSPDESSKES